MIDGCPTIVSLALAADQVGGKALAWRVAVAAVALFGKGVAHDKQLDWSEAGALLAAALWPFFHSEGHNDPSGVLRTIADLPVRGLKVAQRGAEPQEPPINQIGEVGPLRGWVAATLGPMVGVALSAADGTPAGVAGRVQYGIKIWDDGRGAASAEMAAVFEDGTSAIVTFGERRVGLDYEESRFLAADGLAKIGTEAVALTRPAEGGSNMEEMQVRLAAIEATVARKH